MTERTISPPIELRDVANAHRPIEWGRWLLWIFVLVVAANFAWIVAWNENFGWPIVAQWFTADSILRGLSVTLGLTVVAMVIGTAIGLVLAIARMSDDMLFSSLAGLFIWFFRGTPLLVQLFLIYYGLGQFEAVRDSLLWPVLREPLWCAVLALALNTTAYTAEILRGGILSVPYGQIEAARACGMSRSLVFRRIVMPQALRQALPAYGNEVILMVKATSLASTVTLMEVTGIARAIMSRTFAPVEVFVVAGAVYLIINFLASQAVLALERRLSPERRRL